MKDKKITNGTKYLIIGTLVLFLSVIGASVAYYLARVQGTITGRAAGTELTINVEKLSTNANGDLIPLDNDLETLNLAALGYENNGSCVDINGYSVCQIYKVTLTNNGTVPLKVNGTVSLSGQNTPNIDCARMDDESSITNNNSCKSGMLVQGDTLNANSHNDYYIMVYINNLDEPQSDSGEFNGTVTFTSEDGKKVKGRFTKGIPLVEYLNDLYEDSNKTVITANAEYEWNQIDDTHRERIITKTIDYNYAPSVNLMKDRYGDDTIELNSGNIRYYGANPNNYIDIGDRDLNNNVILWRIIGIFDDKVRIVRNESIGDYSWDTSISSINNGYGINEWSEADLMKLLNPGYENNQDTSCSNCVYNSSTKLHDCDCTGNIPINNSLWWNSESGTCYNELYSQTTACDFTSSGLSQSVKNKLVEQTVFLGAGTAKDASKYANQLYKIERDTNVVQNPKDGITRTTKWTGMVSLLYPSDYAYAIDFTLCKKASDTYVENVCKKNDWLFNSSMQNLITPYYSEKSTNDEGFSWIVYQLGTLMPVSSGSGKNIRPVLTLNPNTLIEGINDGSMEHPYKLVY